VNEFEAHLAMDAVRFVVIKNLRETSSSIQTGRSSHSGVFA
jgi:hypothetical protein